MRQNTWADPQDRYRPVRPESYGPVLPKAYVGPTLADVYAYPTDGGPVYYGGTPAYPRFRTGFRADRSELSQRLRGPGARISALAAGAERHLGGTLLRLRAAADRSRQDLDQSAGLHLQTDLRLTADGEPAAGPAAARPRLGLRFRGGRCCSRGYDRPTPDRPLRRRPRRSRRRVPIWTRPSRIRRRPDRSFDRFPSASRNRRREGLLWARPPEYLGSSSSSIARQSFPAGGLLKIPADGGKIWSPPRRQPKSC